MSRVLLTCLLLLAGQVSARAAERLVFYTSDFPPFAYQGSVSQIDGPFAEIIQGWCREEKLRCSMNAMSWRTAQAKARDGGGADGGGVFGLFPMGRNSQREEWLHFSRPVLASNYGLFVFRGNDLVFDSIQDLAGYEIITFGPSNISYEAQLIAQQVPDVTVTILPGVSAVVREMRRPEAHDPAKTAFFGNAHILAWKLRQFGGGPVRFAGKERDLLYHIGFPKDTAPKALVDRFNLYIGQLQETGKLAAILEKWDIPAPPEPGPAIQ